MSKNNKKTKQTLSREQAFVLRFSELGIADIPLVGGKNASLGEMYCHLASKGVPVPNGFAITANAYRTFLRESGLDKKIKTAVVGLNVRDVRALARVGKQIRAMILSASLSGNLKKEIIEAYANLCKDQKEKNISVAVRSSATAEDLPEASFAGQQETYLNVRGNVAIIDAVRKCISSLFTDRAISYREANGYSHTDVALSVGVQQMVHSDTGASGVLFTLDTESGFRGVVLINASYGLGEYVVKGEVTPDQFYVFKEGVRQNKEAVVSRILGPKKIRLGYGPHGGTKQYIVPKKMCDQFAITNAEAITLSKWSLLIEDHYKKPMDIEWAKDGQTNKLYIVQARPETVASRKNVVKIEDYRLKKNDGKILLTGMAVGSKIGAGQVRVIESPKQMASFKKGEILVTRITDPDWEPVMRIASAIITEEGGKTSHAAIVSREIGVPAIVGARGARKIFKTGQMVTVDCSHGDEGRIFQGKLPFEVHTTELTNIPKTKTKIMMNVGDPDHAFDLSFLPNDGVGLARLEFIFTNFIKIHPLALLGFNKLKDKIAKKRIAGMTHGYADKGEYCIERLADGIGRIATAFYPNDVIVRLSDFKTNEYATLIGGKEFEPHEENPMIGWRGASRYYSPEYKPAFRLECEAIKRVRERCGLSNVVVMVPFCRTPEEGEKVLATMKEFGLERGKNGLRVVVMCEIPSNVILAEDFTKIFDGFSIGSNDLTQLTLGVDRDSARVAPLYSEKNKAVTGLIRQVIRTAKKYKKYIGICGQAPSDYPEFAEMLVREGIESISLNPDVVVSMRQRIAKVEKTIGSRGRLTHTPLLLFLGLCGVLASGLIMLGAGCTTQTQNENSKNLNSEVATPASLREILAKKAQDDLASWQKNTYVSFSSAHIVPLSLQYPAGWSIEEWRDGLTISNPQTGEYVSIFKQTVARQLGEETRQAKVVGGITGTAYVLSATTSLSTAVVEVLVNGEIIEIDGVTADFDKILSTISFSASSTFPNRPLNKWDLKEGRACIQVITYAQQNNNQSCVPFPTPCDVPDGWTVCDG